MITYAVIAFAIAAVGGIVLASRVLTGRFAPWALSVVHALLGAAGLLFLIAQVVLNNGPSRATAALALLVIAALGGFYLASLHLRKQIAPKGVVLVHAGVAVAGFLTLLSVFLGA
ncbi:MAG TPA: hypothetical protein VFS17_00165 [Methylophilaceae bacterium]|nr:hypothetical protein [Methylophilaceae bacterium]